MFGQPPLLLPAVVVNDHVGCNGVLETNARINWILNTHKLVGLTKTMGNERMIYLTL